MFSFRLLTSALLLLAPPLVHAQTSIHLGLRLGANWASRAGDDPTYRPSSGIGTVTPTVVYTQDYTRSGLLAPQFGAVLDVRFGKLSVQPAVLFSQKGADQRIADHYTVTYGSAPVYYGSTSDEQYHFVSRPNYLEIPLHFVLTTGGDNGFQVFAGPYVAFGMGGRAKIDTQRTGSSGINGSSTSRSYSYGTTFMLFQDAYPGAAPVSPSDTSPTVFEASSGAIVARRFDAGLNAGIGYRIGSLQTQLGYGLGLVNQQPGKASTQREELPAYYQRVVTLTASYFFKLP